MINLFLVALEKMQKDGLGMLMKEAGLGPLEDKDEVNWSTFYNLSGRFTVSSYKHNALISEGIHSNPLEHWNGVDKRMLNEYRNEVDDEENRDKDYRRHGSIVSSCLYLSI